MHNNKSLECIQVHTFHFAVFSDETFFTLAGILSDANPIVTANRIATDCKAHENLMLRKSGFWNTNIESFFTQG